MATKVPIPGTDQTADLTSPLDAVSSVTMAMFGFLLALIAGGAASYVYNNIVVPNTPEQISEVNLD
jgi:hypothetical protein